MCHPEGINCRICNPAFYAERNEKGLIVYANVAMSNHGHQNPVRACIVQYPEEYLKSSAGNYANIPGQIEITKIE